MNAFLGRCSLMKNKEKKNNNDYYENIYFDANNIYIILVVYLN